MHQLLSAQYKNITDARGVLFTYCRSMENADLFKPVAAFNNNCMVDLLIHTAQTYVNWLVLFHEDGEVTAFDKNKIKDMDAVELMYKDADWAANNLLLKHSADYLHTFTKQLPGRETYVTITPLQLFTHVITHEFHHKGQILSMSRLLGYTPVDTDVIRT